MTELNKCKMCGQKLLLPDSIKQGLCTYHSDIMVTSSTEQTLGSTESTS